VLSHLMRNTILGDVQEGLLSLGIA